MFISRGQVRPIAYIKSLKYPIIIVNSFETIYMDKLHVYTTLTFMLFAKRIIYATAVESTEKINVVMAMLAYRLNT